MVSKYYFEVYPFKSCLSLGSACHSLILPLYLEKSFILIFLFVDAVESKFDEDSEATFTCPVFVVPGATVQWSRENGDQLPSGAHQEADKLM